MKIELIVDGTATGDAYFWNGGTGTFAVVGTFGGATVSLQFLGPDETTWIDCGEETTLTAAGGANFTLASGYIRASVTGSPTGIYATATSIQENTH